MPIRDRIIWGKRNPFSDPRLKNLHVLVKSFRRGIIPKGVSGGSVFKNILGDLPPKTYGYYRKYDCIPPTHKGPGSRGSLRIILGKGGEVYITGNHYRDFRQIIEMPL
jgi:guanyl-specific ribonuclease Sa